MIMPRILLLLCLLRYISSQTPKGIQGFYLAPHDLSRESQVFKALLQIEPLLQIPPIIYKSNDTTYNVTNITISCTYLQSKQQVDINDYNQVQIFGGVVEFAYKLNFTYNKQNGYAYGTLRSNSLNYTKQFVVTSTGFLQWGLKQYLNITIDNTSIVIKKSVPSNSKTIQDLLMIIMGNSTEISPRNLSSSLILLFNQQFSKIINLCLNSEVLNEKVNYTFHSGIHQMTMNIIHNVQIFNIDKNQGYKIIYSSKIQNWDGIQCINFVPQEHLSYSNYGGFQTIHMHCFYESVIMYLNSKGWLDTILDESWQVNAFQFYIGDLYDIINNLYLYTNPRSIVQGSCSVSTNTIHLSPTKSKDVNSYNLQMSYACNMQTNDKFGQILPVIKFIAPIVFTIEVNVNPIDLNFKIIDITVKSLTSQKVGVFQITNLPFAIFKVQQVINKIINTNVFGTGFPTLSRDFPKIRIFDDYILYFDPSHRSVDVQ